MKNLFLVVAIAISGILFTMPVFGQLSGEWKLTGIMKNGSAVSIIDTSKELSIKFADGQASGSGGCNRYFGQYQAGDSRIKIGPVHVTRIACRKEGVATQETLYLNILEKATKFTLVSGTLTLMNGSNRLTFKTVPAPPENTEKH